MNLQRQPLWILCLLNIGISGSYYTVDFYISPYILSFNDNF